MSDLKERLRDGYTQGNQTWPELCQEAADTIEALEAKLAVARKGLERIARGEIRFRYKGAGERTIKNSRVYLLPQMPRDLARTTLERLKT